MPEYFPRRELSYEKMLGKRFPLVKLHQRKMSFRKFLRGKLPRIDFSCILPFPWGKLHYIHLSQFFTQSCLFYLTFFWSARLKVLITWTQTLNLFKQFFQSQFKPYCELFKSQSSVEQGRRMCKTLGLVKYTAAHILTHNVAHILAHSLVLLLISWYFLLILLFFLCR